MRSVVVVQGFYEWKVCGCFHLSVGRDYFDCAYVSHVPVYNIPICYLGQTVSKREPGKFSGPKEHKQGEECDRPPGTAYGCG